MRSLRKVAGIKRRKKERKKKKKEKKRRRENRHHQTQAWLPTLTLKCVALGEAPACTNTISKAGVNKTPGCPYLQQGLAAGSGNSSGAGNSR